METQFEIKADRLAALLSGASAAISTDKRDPDVFRAVNLRLEGGELRAAATDRYIMALGTVTGCDPTLSGNAYLMPDTIKAMMTMLKPLKGNLVTLSYDNGVILKSADNVGLFDHVALSYPDLDKVIPTEFEGLDGDGITVDPKNLLRLCKATNALIKWKFNGALKAMFGTALDDYGISWQLMVMPCRIK